MGKDEWVMANPNISKRVLAMLKHDYDLPPSAKRLGSRLDLASTMPHHGRVAEIGVFRGVNAADILKHNDPEELVLVDPWKHYICGCATNTAPRNMSQASLDAIYFEVVERFLGDARVRIVRQTSKEASELFTDGYFDWVYIDGNHEKEYVDIDFEVWSPKVKIGGYLCGHDYSTAPAVYDAVDRYNSRPEWTLEYVTNRDGAESFALRRLA